MKIKVNSLNQTKSLAKCFVNSLDENGLFVTLLGDIGAGKTQFVRFVLEFLRYDAVRGEAFGLSTSQWISIVVFVGTIISIIYRKKKCIKKTTN